MLVSHFGDGESESAGKVDDDGGPFVHACYCGKWEFFGYDVMLMKGRTGTWFCAEHRPADEAAQHSTDVISFRPPFVVIS